MLIRGHHNGFSLLEVLIGLAISTLILTGFFSIYLQVKQQLARQVSRQSIQEHLLLATGVFQYALRNVGYFGCRSVKTGVPIHKAIVGFQFNPIIRIYKPTEHAQLPRSIRRQIVTTSDALSVVEADYITHLSSKMNDDRHLVLRTNTVIKPHDIMLVSNCNHVEIAAVESVLGNKESFNRFVTLQQSLAFRYSKNATVMLIKRHYYFLRQSKVKGRTEFPALYTDTKNTSALELIPDIVALKFHPISKDKQLVAIAVDVLAANHSHENAKTSHYVWDGVQHKNSNGILHKSLQTWIRLRNLR